MFAWSAYEAPGVDPNFICHHLNVNPSVIPKNQPHRHSSKEHSDAVKEEVAKLKWSGVIKEVFYPEWLANTVVVKKKSGKWRVCVDFTDLNKACPKDPFPMPQIVQLMDANVGPSNELFRCLSRISLDTISSRQSEEDCFCSTHWELPLQVMPFGLKMQGLPIRG